MGTSDSSATIIFYALKAQPALDICEFCAKEKGISRTELMFLGTEGHCHYCLRTSGGHKAEMPHFSFGPEGRLAEFRQPDGSVEFKIARKKILPKKHRTT